MLKLLESTLLGPAAGTDTTGRRLVAYQVQMPMKRNKTDNRMNTDNSKITKLSETLEIVYEGIYDLLGLQGGPVPIDITITITMTWVINKQRKSRVAQRYRDHPYLRITMSCDSEGNLDRIRVPETFFWREAYPKLIRYQLGCPAHLEFGMDRDPAQCLTTFMSRAAAALLDTHIGQAPVTNLQRHSLLLETLLGRTGNATDQSLGIPISWISDASPLQLLQTTARATLPTSNPDSDTVARLPTANTNDSNTSGYIDWEARRAEQAAHTPERLEDNPLGLSIMDIYRRQRLQEEIDRQAAASAPLDAPPTAATEEERHILDIFRRQLLQEETDRQTAASALLDAPTNEAKEEELQDLEIDLNNLDQQRSEHQRLQEEADMKPAAKTVKSNDDGDKKMPAKTAIVSNAEATKWLRQHKAKVSIEDGSVQADCPIPPQIQQWLDNERREAAVL